MDGWKGPGKDSMGTGFMVGNHTFVTNAHVVIRKMVKERVRVK